MVPSDSPIGKPAPPRYSSSIEDYTKVVYGLTEWDDDGATTSRIAAKMGVSNSSASEMIRKLGELGLVQHVPYGEVKLTAEGTRIALRLVRRHRLIESYLVTALGYAWDEVHAEAEVLEHAVSDMFVDRIAEVLGNPVLDPHGDPIPGRDGEITTEQTRVLSELEPGAQGVVARVSDADPELLRYLTERSIALGDPIEVLAREPFDGPLVVRIGDAVHTFGSGVTAALFVRA